MPLKPQQLRDFWQRFGRPFGHQRIYGIEQRIFGPLKAVIDVITELSQCVNIQEVKAPFQDSLVELYFFKALLHKVGGPFV